MIARSFRALVRGIVAVPGLPLVVLAALIARRDTAARRRRGERPRVVLGPEPVISISYWTAALRQRGYQAQSCVAHHFAINERSDFDHYYEEFLPRGLPFDPLRGYAVFLWVLRNADIYLSFFDGGFMRGTALRRLELPLLRLAGKCIIVSPYGSDIAVPGHLDVAEERLLEDYPSFVRNARRTRRRVLQFARWANVVVRNYQYGFMPRSDVLWPTQIAIDTERWQASPPPGDGDGTNGAVVVLHAPNHRRIKGSDRLIEAVEHLAAEGLDVRLELLERRPNEEVRAAVHRADIVADQFVAGYALFAIEGMAAGRPVISAISWLPEEVRADLDRRDLPIVDGDLETLEPRLRELVTDPLRRAALGVSGRRFVVENHSYEAVGARWAELIEAAWNPPPR